MPVTAISPRPSAALPRCPGLRARTPFPPVPLRLKGAPAQTGARAATTPQPAETGSAARPRDVRNCLPGPQAAPLLLGGLWGSGPSAPPRRRGLPSVSCSRCLRWWGARARPRPLPPSSDWRILFPPKIHPPPQTTPRGQELAPGCLPGHPPYGRRAQRPAGLAPRHRPPPPARQHARRRQASAFSFPLASFLGGWGFTQKSSLVFHPNSGFSDSAASSVLHLTLRGLPPGRWRGPRPGCGRPAGWGQLGFVSVKVVNVSIFYTASACDSSFFLCSTMMLFSLEAGQVRSL